MNSTNLDLPRIVEALRAFAKEREWEQFHSPKNLASALSVEASELLEIYQWMGSEDSRKPSEKVINKAKEEVADILYYLVRFADVAGIDIEKAFWDKINKNAEKYPVELAKGNSKKYNEL